jgi:hypothetical protein
VSLQETGEIAKEFSVLSVQDLITKDIDELRVQAQEHRDKTQEQIRGDATVTPSHHMLSLSSCRPGAGDGFQLSMCRLTCMEVGQAS